MGTSSSGAGAGGRNPLIPSWIDDGSPGASPQVIPTPSPLPPVADGNPQIAPFPQLNNINPVVQVDNNRYRQPRRDFNSYIKSGGRNGGAIRNALKAYSRSAAGTTGNLARRMQPAGARVSTFYQAINSFKDRGQTAALSQFNLAVYDNRPLYEILSALTDVVFADTGKLFEDTQDDSLTKAAYSNTIIRICEMDGIDLNSLTNEQIQVMTAVFIEETIVHRVITDIGNKLTEKNVNIADLIEMENNIYQIVSGLVRTSIIPEIATSQLGNRNTFNSNVENIYRIAFDTIAEIN